MTGEEGHGRAVVAARSGGVCELCGRARATDWHHRCNRSQGGTWEPANGLGVCRACHAWVTTHPHEAYERGWLVPRGDDPAATPCVLLTEFGEMPVLLDPDGGVSFADDETREEA